MKKDCKIKNNNDRKGEAKAPGLCSKCQKGNHWANPCHSKFHKDRNPLLGNAFGKCLSGPSWGLPKQSELMECSPIHISYPNIRKQSIYDLLPATSGSAAVDSPALDNQLLMPSMGICKIPTGIWGPLPKKYCWAYDW